MPVRALNRAVLVGDATVVASSRDPEIGAELAVAAGEILGVATVTSVEVAGAETVGAMLRRHPAAGAQGVLQGLGQSDKALAPVDHRHMAPATERQAEMEQPVLQHFSCDRDRLALEPGVKHHRKLSHFRHRKVCHPRPGLWCRFRGGFALAALAVPLLTHGFRDWLHWLFSVIDAGETSAAVRPQTSLAGVGGEVRGSRIEGRKLPARSYRKRKTFALGGSSDRCRHLGGKTAVPVTVALAESLLSAFMAIGTEQGGDLPLNELLQAVARQLGISSPAKLPSSSYAREEAPQSSLGMVRLVELVLEPGKRTCPPLATPAGANRFRLSRDGGTSKITVLWVTQPVQSNQSPTVRPGLSFSRNPCRPDAP